MPLTTGSKSLYIFQKPELYVCLINAIEKIKDYMYCAKEQETTDERIKYFVLGCYVFHDIAEIIDKMFSAIPDIDNAENLFLIEKCNFILSYLVSHLICDTHDRTLLDFVRKLAKRCLHQPSIKNIERRGGYSLTSCELDFRRIILPTFYAKSMGHSRQKKIEDGLLSVLKFLEVHDNQFLLRTFCNTREQILAKYPEYRVEKHVPSFDEKKSFELLHLTFSACYYWRLLDKNQLSVLRKIFDTKGKKDAILGDIVMLDGISKKEKIDAGYLLILRCLFCFDKLLEIDYVKNSLGIIDNDPSFYSKVMVLCNIYLHYILRILHKMYPDYILQHSGHFSKSLHAHIERLQRDKIIGLEYKSLMTLVKNLYSVSLRITPKDDKAAHDGPNVYDSILLSIVYPKTQFRAPDVAVQQKKERSSREVFQESKNLLAADKQTILYLYEKLNAKCPEEVRFDLDNLPLIDKERILLLVWHFLWGNNLRPPFYIDEEYISQQNPSTSKAVDQEGSTSVANRNNPTTSYDSDSDSDKSVVLQIDLSPPTASDNDSNSKSPEPNPSTSKAVDQEGSTSHVICYPIKQEEHEVQPLTREEDSGSQTVAMIDLTQSNNLPSTSEEMNNNINSGPSYSSLPPPPHLHPCPQFPEDSISASTSTASANFNGSDIPNNAYPNLSSTSVTASANTNSYPLYTQQHPSINPFYSLANYRLPYPLPQFSEGSIQASTSTASANFNGSDILNNAYPSLSSTSVTASANTNSYPLYPQQHPSINPGYPGANYSLPYLLPQFSAGSTPASTSVTASANFNGSNILNNAYPGLSSAFKIPSSANTNSYPLYPQQHPSINPGYPGANYSLPYLLPQFSAGSTPASTSVTTSANVNYGSNIPDLSSAFTIPTSTSTASANVNYGSNIPSLSSAFKITSSANTNSYPLYPQQHPSINPFYSLANYSLPYLLPQFSAGSTPASTSTTSANVNYGSNIPDLSSAFTIPTSTSTASANVNYGSNVPDSKLYNASALSGKRLSYSLEPPSHKIPRLSNTADPLDLRMKTEMRSENDPLDLSITEMRSKNAFQASVPPPAHQH